MERDAALRRARAAAGAWRLAGQVVHGRLAELGAAASTLRTRLADLIARTGAGDARVPLPAAFAAAALSDVVAVGRGLLEMEAGVSRAQLQWSEILVGAARGGLAGVEEQEAVPAAGPAGEVDGGGDGGMHNRMDGGGDGGMFNRMDGGGGGGAADGDGDGGRGASRGGPRGGGEGARAGGGGGAEGGARAWDGGYSSARGWGGTAASPIAARGAVPASRGTAAGAARGGGGLSDPHSPMHSDMPSPVRAAQWRAAAAGGGGAGEGAAHALRGDSDGAGSGGGDAGEGGMHSGDAGEWGMRSGDNGDREMHVGVDGGGWADGAPWDDSRDDPARPSSGGGGSGGDATAESEALSPRGGGEGVSDLYLNASPAAPAPPAVPPPRGPPPAHAFQVAEMRAKLAARAAR